MNSNKGIVIYTTSYNSLNFQSFSASFGNYSKQKLSKLKVILNQGSTNNEYPYFQEECNKRYKLNTKLETIITFEICNEGLKFTFDSSKLGGSYIINYIDIDYDTFKLYVAPTYAIVPSKFDKPIVYKKIELANFNVKGLREECKKLNLSITKNSKRKDIEELLRKTGKYY